MIVALLLAALCALLLLPRWLQGFTARGWTRPNYRGRPIPLGMGLLLVAAASVGLVALAFTRWPHGGGPLLFGLVLWVIAGLGWWDDRAGDQRVKGFRGHLRALLRGQLTSGGLKLVGGSLVALAVGVAFAWPGAREVAGAQVAHPAAAFHPGVAVVNALVLALATNIINALDLRPGRATKGFWLGLGLIALFGGSPTAPVWPLAVASIVLLPYDLAALLMLGDTGSNLLGFALGFSAVATLSWSARLVALAILVALQVVVERSSLTRWIERIAPLRYLDLLGRAAASRFLAGRDGEAPVQVGRE